MRADPQIGRRLDSAEIDETPILGRKLSSLPLFNSAFRQGKGTGDLFVNATYFVTGGGSRRTMTFMLDGASNDEGWGRQTMLATVPVGAVQEMSVLSNAFSAEYRLDLRPGDEHRDQVGHERAARRGALHGRPGGWQAKTFSTDGFCPPSVSTLHDADHASSDQSRRWCPDELNQVSGSVGGAIVSDKTFFFASADYTRQDRTTFLSNTLPSCVLPPDGSSTYVGNYRQDAPQWPRRSQAQAETVADVADQLRSDVRHESRTTRSSARTRRRWRGNIRAESWTGAGNHTSVMSSNLVNEARVAYLDGDPVTLWEAQELSTTYTRAGSAPFTIGESRCPIYTATSYRSPIRCHGRTATTSCGSAAA